MKSKKLFLPLAAFGLLVGLVACNNGAQSESKKSEESQQSSVQPSSEAAPASSQEDASAPEQESSEPESSQAPTVQQKIKVEGADGAKKITGLGKTLQLTASVDGQALTGVTWESKNTAVATVDSNGLVASVAKGSAQITANKDGYQQGAISVTVELEKIVVSAAENKTTLVMEETVQLSAKINEQDAEGIEWTSSNNNVATVSNAGLVTALYAGTATITASKDNYTAGTISITVTRPAALATLHFEDADHYSADGWWGTADEGHSPIYARSSGNASDAQCIAHFDTGDKETLTFTSDAAISAEVVMTMASSSEIADVGAVMSAKFNNVAVDLAGKSFAGGSTSEFAEFSLGNLNIQSGVNTLELEFLGSSTPYIDDLAIYSKQQATIAIQAAPARDTIEVKFEEGKTNLVAFIGEEVQIELNKPENLDGVTFAVDKEDVATVGTDGKITGVALGTANITIKKDGWYSTRVEVVVEKATVAGEIRVEAENQTNELPSGFHRYTDRTTGITAGHSGSAYITGYDVSSECSLEYSFESTKDQVMTLVIAGASHYQMSEAFNFSTDCVIKLNGTAITVNPEAQIESNQAMGAPTVEVTIGDVNVVSGTNTFVIEFANRAPALDCFRFMPKA